MPTSPLSVVIQHLRADLAPDAGGMTDGELLAHFLSSRDDDALAAKVRLLRSHGMTAPTWDRHRGHASAYDVVVRGFNYRIDEARAALASSRLRRLDKENAMREQLDARYRRAFESLGLTVALPPADGLVAAHHLFAVVLPKATDRDAFRRYLSTQGVQTSVHYPALHRTTLYATGTRLPVTEDYADRCVSLPMFAQLSDAQQDLVISSVREALEDESVRSPRAGAASQG